MKGRLGKRGYREFLETDIGNVDSSVPSARETALITAYSARLLFLATWLENLDPRKDVNMISEKTGIRIGSISFLNGIWIEWVPVLFLPLRDVRKRVG